MRTTLVLREVLKAATDDALGAFDVMESELSALPTRFPVQVDQQTRVFLECQAKALGTSIAALAGTILNQVVANTLRNRSTGQKRKTRGT